MGTSPWLSQCNHPTQRSESPILRALAVEFVPPPLHAPSCSSPKFALGLRGGLAAVLLFLAIAAVLTLSAWRWSKCPLRISPTCLGVPSTHTSIVPAVSPRMVLGAASLHSPSIAVRYYQTAAHVFYPGYALTLEQAGKATGNGSKLSSIRRMSPLRLREKCITGLLFGRRR